MNIDILKSELIRDVGFVATPRKCDSGKLITGVNRNLDDCPLTQDEFAVVGHDGRDEKITLEAASYLLGNDIRRTCESLNRSFPWWTSLDEVRRRVMVNMAFSIGTNGLLGYHTIIGWIRQGHYASAAGEMQLSAWAEQVGDRASRLARMMRTGVA